MSESDKKPNLPGRESKKKLIAYSDTSSPSIVVSRNYKPILDFAALAPGDRLNAINEGPPLYVVTEALLRECPAYTDTSAPKC